MYFLITFSLILIYIRKIEFKIKDMPSFAKYYFPVFFILFFTFAFQYDVGTDYFSYLAAATKDDLGVFKYNQFIADKEYLFALLIQISWIVKSPQFLFVLTSLIQNILLGISTYQLSKRKISLFNFFMLYFSLSVCFFYQFNAIRQFIAVNLLFLAILLLLDNEKSIYGWICVICSPFFHQSSLIFIFFICVFIILKNKININKKLFFLLCTIAFLLYFANINDILMFVINKTGTYTEYLDNIFVQKLTFSQIITKIVKLFVIFYAIYKLEIEKLTKYEKNILLISLFSTVFMILSFSSSLLWRFYLFFDIFIIFPVLLFFKYNTIKKEEILIDGYLIFFLLVKILVIPTGEYLYSNIFWR